MFGFLQRSRSITKIALQPPAPQADRHGLALVLMFIGAKMLLIDVYKIPITLSLGVVAATIGTTIALSMLRPQASPPAGHG